MTGKSVVSLTRRPGAIPAMDDSQLAAVEALAPATTVASLDSALVAPSWPHTALTASSAALAATPSSHFSLHSAPSAVDVLQEHARAIRQLQDGIQHLSRGPGSEMQTQLRLDHESSQLLRQNLLLETIRSNNNNSSSSSSSSSNQLQLLQLLQHRPIHVDRQQHFQQQQQIQIQRLREAAAAELAMGARGQRTLDDLILAARVGLSSDVTNRNNLFLPPPELPSTNNRLRP